MKPVQEEPTATLRWPAVFAVATGCAIALGVVGLLLRGRSTTPKGFKGVTDFDAARRKLQDQSVTVPRGTTITAPAAVDGVGAGEVVLTQLVGPRIVRTPRGERAALRFGPGATEPAIYHVADGDRVRAVNFRQTGNGLWLRVETPDGASGWVRGDLLADVE